MTGRRCSGVEEVETVVARVVRTVGWLSVSAGVLVLLYVVYLVWFTNLETAAQQRALADRFPTATAPAGDDATTGEDGGELAVAAPFDLSDTPTGAPVAAIWFTRDDERLFHDDPVYVVAGTGVEELKGGPGYYPASAPFGGDGNAAIAGHRVTYGAPFQELDALRDGDVIHVQDLAGTEWRYAYREQRVVTPTDTWVVDEDDPLGTGAPTLTLTTCHPRYSAAQRLIVFAELLDPADPDASGTPSDGPSRAPSGVPAGDDGDGEVAA